MSRIRWNPFEVSMLLVQDGKTGRTHRIRKPMSWGDAAKVSAIITLALVFVDFLMGYKTIPLPSEMEQFLWSLFLFCGKSFFATFLALTGIAQYAARDRGENKESVKEP